MSMQLLSDNELVKLYMNGNEESLSILVKRHKRRIFSYIYLITRNKALTEDVFQETFFKVIQTLKKQQYNEEGKHLFRINSSPLPFTCSICFLFNPLEIK